MINKSISIVLPPPWEGQRFETDLIGSVNFLVGPNGSGKSQFAKALLSTFSGPSGSTVRFLSTDRLGGMEQTTHLRDLIGDNFSGGYSRQFLANSRQSGPEGSGVTTIALLAERMDLRIQIEATLSHLFSRDITLEWDSGNLFPRATRRGGGDSYRLDRDECHGIKELLVLLTYLYDKQNHYLIIDEPELNLHPQYQAFFMQEVRKVAGDPHTCTDKKVIFLITHSPFILDLQSEDDLQSVISFDLEYAEPKQVASLELDASTFPIGRLNAHHKQLFFSDNPIFVEGISDASIVQALMEAMDVSVAGAGSCIIDSGGVEVVNDYLRLCLGLRKQAHFIYDLDSLFKGKLRRCIGEDEIVRSFLATAGVAADFGEAYSLLISSLRGLLERILEEQPTNNNIDGLVEFLIGLGEMRRWGEPGWSKARVAVMTTISLHREDVIAVSSLETVEHIEGRHNRILEALGEKNIHVLPGGALERYLPSFNGNLFQPDDNSKRAAVEAEVLEIQNIREMPQEMRSAELKRRYADLYDIVCDLPSKEDVDVDSVLRRHLSDYVHELQKAAKDNPDWQHLQLQLNLSKQPMSESGLVSLDEFERTENGGFNAKIGIIAMQGNELRVLQVTENTTYDNMPNFLPNVGNEAAYDIPM